MLTRPTTLLTHLLSTVERTPVTLDPFPHVEFDGLLPADVYAALISILPRSDQYRGFRILRDQKEGRMTRYKFDLLPEYFAHFPRPQRALMRDVSASLRSYELAAALKGKFYSVLEKRFEQPVERIKVLPVPSLMRDYSGLAYDAHTDTFSKVMTCQIYLPPDLAQVALGTHFHVTKDDGSPGDPVKVVPFAPNHGYAFPVHARSYHSVPTLPDLDRPRDSLLLIFYNTTRLTRRMFYAGKRISSAAAHVVHFRRDRD